MNVVTSVGPMDSKRIVEIGQMTSKVSAGMIFVTAFLDFKTFKKFSESLARETEVWIADMPEHMIHLNGDKFLGPKKYFFRYIIFFIITTMQININDTTIDWQFQKASKYLPVRLSTTFFEGIGECIAFAANRADGMTCDITENDNSEIFLTLMDSSLYEELKRDVLNMDYWSPRNHYNTVTGLADGHVRKIHLDGRYF